MLFLIDFDFDDFAKGGVGFGLKFFITLGLLAIPIIFVRDFDNNVVYGTLAFAIALAVLIINVLSFIKGGIRVISDKSEIKGKLVRNYLISLAVFIVLSIVGYFNPITIFKITMNGFVGLSFLPIISSFILSIALNSRFINKNLKLFDYILISLGTFVTIATLSAIVFFILTFYHRFGIQDGDYKNTSFGNSAKQVFNYIEENAKYYDDSYDKARNNTDIKEILQNKITNIIELSNNEEEIKKLSQLMKLTSGETDKLREDKVFFLTNYSNSKTSMNEFKDNYGLNIKFRNPFDRCENYKQYYILTSYDKATQITHYYLFDTGNFTINKEIPKNEYEEYVNSIIKEAKDSKQYN